MKSDMQPYQTPAEWPDAAPARVLGVGVEAELISQGLLRRKIKVTRPLEAVIEYHAASLVHGIYLDGQCVATRVPWFWFHEQIEFSIPHRDGTLPAKVIVNVGLWLQIQRFELWLDQTMIYRQGGP